MPEKIAIITDSTCDIPAEWREKYDISIVPLTIVWGEDQYLEGIDISPEEFYERLPNDPNHPTTSQPTPKAFLNAFQEAADKGYDQILVIVISGAMSGTILSAQQSAEQSPIPVTIVDSKNNSMGLGWQVIAAAREREKGGNLESMLREVEHVRQNVHYFISLDTMKYLNRGGRIGDAVKFLSSVLNIKPLIYVNHDSGTVGASIPGRSRSSAINGMYKQFFKNINTAKPMHITVLHNAALEEAEELAEKIKQEYNPKELFISIVSPVLGVHTGPKAIAICGYNE
jgi:DegV family protein with EDD domain